MVVLYFVEEANGQLESVAIDTSIVARRTTAEMVKTRVGCSTRGAVRKSVVVEKVQCAGVSPQHPAVSKGAFGVAFDLLAYRLRQQILPF